MSGWTDPRDWLPRDDIDLKASQAALRTREIDPLATTAHIRNAYLRYLKTLYPIRDDQLRAAYWHELERPNMVVTGPLLEGAPPFISGRSVAELVAANVLSPDLLRITGEALPAQRHLYLHQEHAIDRVVRLGRNIVVATGTGSGKTETFLIPILDALVRERATGTLAQPGVRALFLYPMNALANDQIKRLRAILRHASDITFGRYIGETKQTRAQALEQFRQQFPNDAPLRNELLSREEMQQRPPHILLTNFAMLEYLLLRPTDSTLFDGPTGGHWRFIVMDEAHTYDGATGIEVAMLMRRLKDRVVHSERGRLTCIATSATLGKGRQDFGAVAAFASTMFDEPFVHDDIIAATRQPVPNLPAGESAYFDPALYGDLRAAVDRGDTELTDLERVAAKHAVRTTWITDATAAASMLSGEDATSAWIASLLTRDGRLLRLRSLLASAGPQRLDVAVGEIFGVGEPENEQALVDLVSLAVRARSEPSAMATLPARYHLFVRALEGGYVCFGAHVSGGPRVYLNRHETCPECSERGHHDRKVFELAVCARCGAEYVVGRIDGDDQVDSGHTPYLKQHPASDVGTEPFQFILLDRRHADIDEDDVNVEETEQQPASVQIQPGADVEPATLCVVCGALGLGEHSPPGCAHAANAANLRAVSIVGERTRGFAGLRSCIACGARAQRDIVVRLATGQDAPVSVLATHLYERIPPAPDPHLQTKPGQGRKLLIFADSRQDAAFFAPYLNRNHQLFLRRRHIIAALEAHHDPQTPPRIQDMAGWLEPLARAAGWFQHTMSPVERQTIVLRWLMAELVSWDRRNSLEGAGLISFEPVAGSGPLFPQPLAEAPWCLSPEDAHGLLVLLLNTVRQQGVVTYPDGILANDEIFEPRNVQFYIKQADRGPATLSWMPLSHTNKRLNLLDRLLTRQAPALSPEERARHCRDALAGIWTFLNGSSAWKDHFIPEQHATQGTRYRLDYRLWDIRFTGTGETASWWQCERCTVFSAVNVQGMCPTVNCSGMLRPVDATAPLIRENNYRQLYSTLAPIALRSEEHTAQWSSTKASQIQQAFMDGKINVLSCSTTFELGVDVGELQAVLLRNVPPSTANYLQRAGRAGRRSDGTAFVVTFAQRRSHDFTYFRNPVQMVAGQVVPPSIEIANTKIVRRHMHSVALAAFFRVAVAQGWMRFPADVQQFFRPDLQDAGERGPGRLRAYLDERPAVVGEALVRIVPPQLHRQLGILDWSWVDTLVGLPEQPRGVLDRVQQRIDDDLHVLQALVQEALVAANSGETFRLRDVQRFERVKNTVLGRDLLGELGTSNVLPKYSFPVDVVELHTSHVAADVAKDVTLSRDLRQALTDYAPGSEAVAGGRVWKSAGVRLPYKRTGADSGWDLWAYAVCPTCLAFTKKRGEVPEVCPVCQEHIERPYRGLSGTFIVPEFGFVASPDHVRNPGESRPQRLFSSQVFFTHETDDRAHHSKPSIAREDGDTFESVSMLGVRARYSRHGRLSVVNAGLYGRGFRICETCGFSDPAPLPDRKARRNRNHRNPRTNRECRGFLQTYHLGHTFESDVLEVTIPGVRMSRSDALSVLYALLSGASRSFGIQYDDMDGSLYGSPDAGQTLVIFDSVPGGAGHVRRLGLEPDRTLSSAYDAVADCTCGEETSCYSCLRSYRNQYVHHELRRGNAARILKQVRIPR